MNKMDYVTLNNGIKREDIFLTTKVWVTEFGYEKTKASIEEVKDRVFGFSVDSSMSI